MSDPIAAARKLLVESDDPEVRRVIDGLLGRLTEEHGGDLPALGLDGPVSVEQIKERRAELVKRRKLLTMKQEALKGQFQALYAVCDHKDRYSQNTWGRDPGGGGCNTCGKVW